MSKYQQMASRQRKWFLYIIAIIVIVTIIIPDRHFVLGLLFGTIVSFYNLWLLQRRTNLVGKAAATSGKRQGLGTISRLSMVALGTLITFHYEASIVAYIMGLVLVYPIIMIDFLLFNRE